MRVLERGTLVSIEANAAGTRARTQEIATMLKLNGHAPVTYLEVDSPFGMLSLPPRARW